MGVSGSFWDFLWDSLRLSGSVCDRLGLFVGVSWTVWDSLWPSLGQSGSVWDSLGLSGTVWDSLGVSGTLLDSLWKFLGLSGTICRPTGTILLHIEQLRTFKPICWMDWIGLDGLIGSISDHYYS